MSLPFVNLTQRTVGAFVEDHCANHRSSTTIIFCCRRSYLLRQLVLQASSTTDSLGEQRNTINATGENTEGLRQNFSEHGSNALLHPTLRLLATSLETKVIFCQDILTFRAHLSTLPFYEQHRGGQPARVIVVDMLAMHHGTSEFTVQGLSRTLAMLASVNRQFAGEMQLVECNDAQDPLDPQRGVRLWNSEVPLLSGSVKIGEAGQGWASRTTSIRSFAERWIRFQ